MSAERDVTRIVRSWLRTDGHESADRVLDIVLDRLDTTPQRRAWWPARRLADMNNYARLLVAATAVLVVAIVGINLFSSPQRVAAPAAPSPTPSAEPSASSAGPGEPLVVTARIPGGGPDIGKTTRTEVGGRVERRGTIYDLTITASDPRLQGDLTMSVDQDEYPGAQGPESFVFGAATLRIETADGAWQGSGTSFAVADAQSCSMVLVGEGAYSGLYAALDVLDAVTGNGDIDGVVFPAPPPSAPAAP